MMGPTSKRPAMEDTDAIIQQVLEEKQAAKRQKKEGPSAKGPKGLTWDQLEHAEGGVVKEGMVGVAQVKRAAQRKAARTKDTDLVADRELEGVEEALEVEEDNGITLEPFNLAQERAEGFFDEDGTYIETRGDEDERDAWLTSAEAAKVSEGVRRKVEERERAMAAAEDAPEISATQTAQLKGTIAAILQPGETVTRALKRLRPPQPPRAGRHGKGAIAKPPDTEESRAAQAAFERLTEAASSLTDAGELDVYSQTQEHFKLIAADHEADMFADDEDDGPTVAEPLHAQLDAIPTIALSNKPTTAEPQARPAEAPAPAASGRPAQPAINQEARTDFASWPVKELRRFLAERGVDTAGIVEKPDLVARAHETADAPSEDALAPVPPGYAFDPASGYFHSADAGMYFDGRTRLYFSASTGRWYTWDGSGFVECSAS